MPTLHGIDGPVLTVQGANFSLGEMVAVRGIPGEVIALSPDMATVQAYESTAGLKPGMEVEGTGQPMTVTLEPGIMGGIFDGIMRPLLDRGDAKLWEAEILALPGQALEAGDVFATVQETELVVYKAMVPPGLGGTVSWAAESGEYLVDSPLITLDDGTSLSLSQTWPIRRPRPVRTRLTPDIPLITGQRVIDSLFPLAKGGTCAMPGGFGTGKTMTQHQVAKWCDADIIIYIGCGERGNEMTEVLESFAKLKDPKSDAPLLARTVLIANTSDMPVAAREASIYTGITLAECYRDMGYHVAVMADSTSRWAEALRELSARLGEIPAEEGYPAYLASRLAGFYGRAGYVENLNGTNGSVTIIGAVSPQGADFSEPVTQHTKRFIRCWWALDRRLAYARHFPAIHPTQSYSDYAEELAPWYITNVHPQFPEYRQEIQRILQEESVLEETVKLIGEEALSENDKHTMAQAKAIREDFLKQTAYLPGEAFTPLEKQAAMMSASLES